MCYAYREFESIFSVWPVYVQAVDGDLKIRVCCKISVYWHMSDKTKTEVIYIYIY